MHNFVLDRTARRVGAVFVFHLSVHVNTMVIVVIIIVLRVVLAVHCPLHTAPQAPMLSDDVWCRMHDLEIQTSESHCLRSSCSSVINKLNCRSYLSSQIPYSSFEEWRGNGWVDCEGCASINKPFGRVPGAQEALCM